MITFKLLMALRRATYMTQGFERQCYVIRKFDMYQCREFSNRKTIILEDTTTKPKQRPKTVPVPKITLLSLDNSMVVTDLEKAERLAKHRNLNLIKVSDPDSKTCRAAYKLTSKLVDKTELLQDDKQKSFKLLYISATITKHDLLIKIKNIVKLLSKNNKVKIFITLDDTKENDVLNTITKMVKDISNIKTMPSKKNTALLLITPLDKKDANNSIDNKEVIAVHSTINQRDNA
ncbi:uncharacterized protein LOC116849968 [Odontomachus brunneus]|uniref:uncharacterized protein LOC116849968 n=1 Tax=Odontomachus brunneus TaxID=486640 RepID=UPI0013F19DBA|nr:uncharacterized protein LOC116849968 [Odontomachus brunneus]